MAGEMNDKVELDFKTETGLVLFCFTLSCLFSTTSGSTLLIIPIKDGEEIRQSDPGHFCYSNELVPGWKETWTRIQIQVRSSQKFKVTVVEDEEKLKELEQFNFWTLFQYFIKERSNETTISVNLFSSKTCFKVDPSDKTTSYTISLTRRFDPYLFLVFLAGLLLFFFADELSRSPAFFYSAGISTGMIASLIILVFIVARFLPKKSPFYVLLVGGWSFSLYLIQLVFRNLQHLIKQHWQYVTGYVMLVGFLSFAVCYRHGPLVEERSINLLSWVLQLLGLLLLYAGIQVQQVAVALIIAAVCAKNLEYPVRLGLAVHGKLQRWTAKPEPPRFLTEEEYRKQGEVETQRALEELREYCSSPDFSAWRTISRIGSPRRFAEFVEGGSHLIPSEVSVHEQEYGLWGSFFEEEFFENEEEEERFPLHRNHNSV
ncbi:nuclear envelope integral membrane protein 1 [Huso huso]|uniref:Nuclear envelope integral membrane protein 1 n=1 Tax=Huso huso TaxID=61971 RepID=A0ABR0YEH6_HUSHU